jgi:tetratricopeptide (TPR) repeat protein
VCAFGLATGRPPFMDRTEEELQRSHCYGRPPDPRAVHPGISEVWARALERALAKDPADRFQTAAQFARALEEVLRPPPVPAPRPPVRASPPTLPAPLERPPEHPTVPPGLRPRRVLPSLLERYRRAPLGDTYATLGVAPGAGMAELWEQGARRLSELSELAHQQLSEAEQREVRQFRRRVVRALCELGLPQRRILRDAAQGNLAGVARCIAVLGEKATLALREARPLPRATARLARRYRRLGQAWARLGRWERALAAWRRALEYDPLEVALHRQYWALQREVLEEHLAQRPH